MPIPEKNSRRFEKRLIKLALAIPLALILASCKDQKLGIQTQAAPQAEQGICQHLQSSLLTAAGVEKGKLMQIETDKGSGSNYSNQCVSKFIVGGEGEIGQAAVTFRSQPNITGTTIETNLESGKSLVVELGNEKRLVTGNSKFGIEEINANYSFALPDTVSPRIISVETTGGISCQGVFLNGTAKGVSGTIEDNIPPNKQIPITAIDEIIPADGGDVFTQFRTPDMAEAALVQRKGNNGVTEIKANYNPYQTGTFTIQPENDQRVLAETCTTKDKPGRVKITVGERVFYYFGNRQQN